MNEEPSVSPLDWMSSGATSVVVSHSESGEGRGFFFLFSLFSLDWTKPPPITHQGRNNGTNGLVLLATFLGEIRGGDEQSVTAPRRVRFAAFLEMNMFMSWGHTVGEMNELGSNICHYMRVFLLFYFIFLNGNE